MMENNDEKDDEEAWYDDDEKRRRQRFVLRERWEMGGGSGTDRPKDRGKEGGETRRQSVHTGKEQEQIQTRTEETSVYHGKQRGKETKRDAETSGRERENGRAMATDEEVCRRPERADVGTGAKRKKFFARYEGECTKCSEKDTEESTMGVVIRRVG